MKRYRLCSVGGMFVIVLLALVFVMLVGCDSRVQVEGGQKHDVHVTHDPQRTDIYIHRDRKKHPNQSPK